MNNYKKRILLSVTGMSPAVVTETLYALITEKQFIPTEIRVVTTLQGKNKLLDVLLGIEGGRKKSKGALEEFIEDYGKQYNFEYIQFDESCISVIEDIEHQPLSDIRTPTENQCAANRIVQLVGELCQDSDSAIHVSIAGGRKTMGFFLGYALSLYGRKQDSLSHVLVDSQFENVPSFFYPKPYPYLINDLQGKQIDASQGKVMLAEIPWVRLGLGVPTNLLNHQISYSDSVDKAQQVLDIPSITFLSPLEDHTILFGKQPVQLSPRGYSLMLGLVIAQRMNWKFSYYGKYLVQSQQLYYKIYDLLTGRSIENTDFEGVLSDSRIDIYKKIKCAFSLGKGGKSDYIPKRSHKSYYELLVELENIDTLAIEREFPDLFR